MAAAPPSARDLDACGEHTTLAAAPSDEDYDGAEHDLVERLRTRHFRRTKFAAAAAGALAVGLVVGVAVVGPSAERRGMPVAMSAAAASKGMVLAEEHADEKEDHATKKEEHADEKEEVITDAPKQNKTPALRKTLAAKRKCWLVPGVKLAETKPTSPWPSCSQKWSEDCTDTGCCVDWGMKCYKKNHGWASCKKTCEEMDDKNETWSCDVIYPKDPHTVEGCQKACKDDPECVQAIFNSDANGLCTLSNLRHTEVVWAGDNFNSSYCGDESEENVIEAYKKKVFKQTPFVYPHLPIANCSWGGEDCAHTKCCNEVKCDAKFTNCFGYSCWKKDEYFSSCRADLPPKSWNGTWVGGPREHREIGPAGKQVALQGTSLYCFMVVSWDAPRPKPFWSTEAELADNIKKHGIGIYQCDGHDLYDGIQTPKAEWGSFSNIDAFQKIWKEVQDRGDFKKYDWTVKVDADAVFLPNRLKMHLDKLRTPKAARVYLENTWYQFKFMGALEVVTREALEWFLLNSHQCIRGKHDGGEDFFMKGCMDAIGVDHQSDVDLLKDKYATQDGPCTDGWGVAYHFHKKVISWNWCYNEAVCGNRGKTCPEGLEVEYVMPWKPNPAA